MFVLPQTLTGADDEDDEGDESEEEDEVDEPGGEKPADVAREGLIFQGFYPKIFFLWIKTQRYAKLCCLFEHLDPRKLKDAKGLRKG